MKQTLLVPELRELLAAGDEASLRNFCVQGHPATVAELIGGLEPAEIWRILHLLPVQQRALIFSNFELAQQVELATGEVRGDMARLIEELPHDDRADLVQDLDPEVAEEILPLVSRAEREDIRRLVSYGEDTAGSLMSTDYAYLRPETPVLNALAQVRIQAPQKETIYYIYVVGESHRLIGFVSLKDLILARPQQRIRDIMNENVISVPVEEDQEQVARVLEKYDLLAIPVVDAENRLVGIITHDDVMDVAEAEATEDVHKFGGTEPLDLPYAETGFWTLLRKRGGWLALLFFGQMVTASVMGHFEGEIAAAVVLAVFIPLIISSGGNSGSQAATLIVRALALREIELQDWSKIFFRELLSGLTLGGALGAIGFGRVVLWQHMGWGDYGPHYALLGLTIWFSLVGVVSFGTLAGSMLPLLLRRLGFDPAASSAPFVATLVDVTGLLIYFTAALLILRGTLL